MEPEYSPLTLNPELDNFFAISLDLLCIARFDGYFERLSPGWEEVLGYSLEELQHIKFMSLVHPEDLTRTQDRIRRLTEGLPVENGFSNRYLHKNGYYVTLEWSSRSHMGRIFSSARDISGRLEIERQLKEQHERYTKALEGSNTGVWDIDIFGDTITVSPRWWAIMGEMGQQPNLISHHTFFNRIHPDDLPGIMEFSRGALRQSDHAFELEFRMRHQNGSFVWVLSRGTILVNALGIPYRIVGANTDITEKKQWEDALQSKNLVLEMAGKMARLGYFEVVLESGTYYWSPGMYEIFEVEAGHPIHHSHIEEFYVAGSGQENVRELGRKLVEQNEAFDSEFLIRTGKGREIWIRVWAKAEFRNGSCYRVFGTIQDIDAEKKKRLEELEKEKLLRMLSGSNAGGWEWQVETGKAFCNERWCEILGYTPEEINPMTLDSWMGRIHPDDLDLIHKNWEKVEQGQDQFQTEIRVRHKNGRWIWIQDNGKVFYHPETGKPDMVYGAITDISERKKAELNLLLLQDLIDHSTDGIQICRENGKLVYINNVAAERLGIDPEKVSRYKVLDFEEVFPDADSWKQHVEELKETGPMILIGQNRNKTTGLLHPVEVHATYLKIGNEGYIIASTRDVSERIAAEEKIRYELAFQKALLDISSTYLNLEPNQFEPTLNRSLKEIGEFLEVDTAFVFDYDFDQGVARIAHEWTRDGRGRDLESRLEVPLDQIMPVVRAHREGHFLEMTVEDTLEGPEGEFIRKLMEARHIQSFITLPFRDGDDLMGLIGFDFTTRIKRFSEKERSLLVFFTQMLVTVKNRQAREKQLVTSEEKYRNILNNANMGLLEINTSGIIRFANLGFQRLCGIPEQELTGAHAGFVLYGPGREAEIDDHLKRRKEGQIEAYEMEFTRPDGQVRHWLVSAAPNYNDKGTFMGSVKIFIDVSEKKKLEEEQKVLAELTQNQNHRLRNFAHIVSHNLRSHAGNIRSLVDLQSENAQNSDPEVLNMLQSASKNLMETIEHLSEVAQLTTFDQRGMEYLNLSEFVEKAVSHVSGLALRNGVEIRNEVGDYEIVLGVPAYLESILLNVLTNAIKYRNPERLDGFAAIRTRKKGQFLVLEVEDNGLGINLERHRSKLFGMYKTFHRLPDSKGLGLFITRNQVEAMGGSIEVESTEGKGTTFFISLPYGKN